MSENFLTYYESPLGILEITASERGITSVAFVESSVQVKNPVQERLQECVRQLEEYFAGKRQEFFLALDMDGTEFQLNVWHYLLKIPYGKTVSYLDVAVALGDHNLTRAVGGANSKNPIAIIVPCHRVIGQNTELTGYAGGLWRKRKLLDLEENLMQTSLFAKPF